MCYMKSFLFSESAVSSVQRVRLLLTLWIYLALPSNGTLHFTLASVLAFTVSTFVQTAFEIFTASFLELRVGSLQSYVSRIQQNNRPHKHTCMIYSCMTGRRDLTWARSLSTQIGARGGGLLIWGVHLDF